MSPLTRPGVCRYCGCTEENPCPLRQGGGETCGWADRMRTVCTNDLCLGRWERAKRATEEQAQRRNLRALQRQLLR